LLSACLFFFFFFLLVGSLSTLGESVGELGEVLSLVSGDGEFSLAWLSRSVATSDGTGAIRGSTSYFVVGEQEWGRVSDGDEHETVMNEVWKRGQSGGLLSTVLRCGREEEASWLSSECSLSPEATGGIEQSLELSGHRTEASWEAKEEAISLWELLNVDDGHIGLWWSVHLAQDILGEGLGNLVELDFDARGLSSRNDLVSELCE